MVELNQHFVVTYSVMNEKDELMEEDKVFRMMNDAEVDALVILKMNYRSLLVIQMIVIDYLMMWTAIVLVVYVV